MSSATIESIVSMGVCIDAILADKSFIIIRRKANLLNFLGIKMMLVGTNRVHGHRFSGHVSQDILVVFKR